jgi:hypothetical protein
LQNTLPLFDKSSVEKLYSTTAEKNNQLTDACIKNGLDVNLPSMKKSAVLLIGDSRAA